MNYGVLPAATPTSHSKPLKFEVLYSRFRERLDAGKPLKLILDCCNSGNHSTNIISKCTIQGFFDFLFKDPRDICICSSRKGKSSYYVINGWTLFTYAINKVVTNAENVEDFLLRLDASLTIFYQKYQILERNNKIIFAYDLKKQEEIAYVQEINKYLPIISEKIEVKEMNEEEINAKILELQKDLENPQKTKEHDKLSRELKKLQDLQEKIKSFQRKIIEENVTLKD